MIVFLRGDGGASRLTVVSSPFLRVGVENFFHHPSNTFVAYTMSEKANPDETAPVIVLDCWQGSYQLNVRTAPELTFEPTVELLAVVCAQLEFGDVSNDDRKYLETFRDWLLKQKEPWICYQLEPDAIQHDGRAVTIGLQARKARLRR